ncbi:MAG: diguanylate cyclase [Acidimicrobiia bacterium]
MTDSTSPAVEDVLSELGIGYTVVDRNGAVIDSNQRAHEIFGRVRGVSTPADGFGAWGEAFAENGEVLPLEDLPIVRAMRNGESVSDEIVGFPLEVGQRDDVVWLLIGAHPVRDDNGEVVGARCSFVDVTEQRAAQAALRDSERRFRLLAENAADLIFRFRVAPEFGFDYVNPTVVPLLGHEPDDFYADFELSLQLMHPEDRVEFRELVAAVISGETEEMEPIVVRMTRGDGTLIWTEFKMVPIYDGRTVVALEGIVRDVTVRVTKEADLSYQARHDQLTGLSNRASLLDALELALATARVNEDGALAVLYVDLDRFKTVNDNLGHEIGDRVLSTVAVRLADAMRPSDVVARLGGDEFAAVLVNLRDTAEAVAVAERLLGAIAQPISIDGSELITTASVGISFSSNAEETPAELLRRADVAMYAAKDRGRARVERYDELDSPPVDSTASLDPSHG